MASLAGLTTRVAAAPGRIVAGTAKNVYSAVKGAVVSQTGIGMLRPTNIAAAIMEKSGLGPLVPSLAGAFGPTGGGPNRTAGTATGSFGQQPFNQPMTAPATGEPPPNRLLTIQTDILNKILGVNQKILEISQKDTKSIESTTKLISDLIVFLKADSVRRQEESREAKAARAAGAANDNTKGGAKGPGIGGMFAGLLSLIPGIGALKTIFSGITGAFDTILKFGGILLRGLLSIGRFLIRFAGPIGAVVAVLLALESQDWEKFFGRFTDAFKDFMEGRWLDGIIKVVVAIPELIVKALFRIAARIAEFFGFEGVAKAIDEMVNEFDLVAILKTMFNYVKDVFINIKDTVVNYFSDAKDKLTEWWNSFSIIDPIIDTFTYLKDSVVNLFTSVKDKVVEWFESAADLGSRIGESLGSTVNNVWEFFKSLPGKLVDAASNLVPDFIKEPFKKLFGSSAPTPAATTTPAAAASTTTPTTQTASTQTPSTTPAVRSTTPAIPSGDIEVQRYAGKSKGEILEDIMSYTGGDVNQAMAEAERIYTKVSKATPAAPPPVQPAANMREAVFNAQSSRQAVTQNAPASPPVIVNNMSAPVSQSSSGGGASNRMGGAVNTSPRSSHMDRALYGNYYGAGVP